MAVGLPPVILSTDFVNNPVHTVARCGQSRCRSKGLRQREQRLSSRRAEGVASAERRIFVAASQRERAGNIVAVTRLRPPFLLR